MRYLIVKHAFQDDTKLQARWLIKPYIYLCFVLFPGMNTIFTQGYSKLSTVTLKLMLVHVLHVYL